MQYDMEELLRQAKENRKSPSRSYAVQDEVNKADLEAGAHFILTEGIQFQRKGGTQSWPRLG